MNKKLRTLGIAAIAGLALAGALVGCSSTGDTTESATDGQSSDLTTLKMGFDEAFPPYTYVDENGDFTGFDVEMATEVAKRNGWDIEYIPVPWDSKDMELNSGNIDCIWSGFTVEGREDGYAFTDAYMNNSQVVMTRTDSGIDSLDDMADKVILVQADSTADTLLSAGGDKADLADTFKELRTTPDYNTAMMELESGSVDAVVVDEPVAKFQIAGKEDIYKILDEAVSEEHFAVGCRLDDTQRADAITATLKEMSADGFIEQLCSEYEGQGISYDAWALN